MCSHRSRDTDYGAVKKLNLSFEPAAKLPQDQGQCQKSLNRGRWILAAESAIVYGFGIEIVIHHTVVGHLFILCAGSSVVAVGVNGNAAPGQEFSPDFNVSGIHQSNQIFHNNIHTILMEIAVIAEREKI